MTEATTGVGAELRRAREEQGLAVTHVAQQLKFAQRQLEALEAERFEELPGGTFVRGMVRNYARLLRIEPEPLLARLADRFDAPDSRQLAARFNQPVPFSDGTRRATLVYLVLSLAILAAVGTAAWQWRRERTAPERLPFVSASSETQRAPVIPAEPVSSAPLPVPAEEKKPQLEEEKVEQKKVEQKTPEEKKPAPAAQRPILPGVYRIAMYCEEEAWLEVHDATGRALVSSLNPAGSERVVQGRGPFEIVIGNAHNVRLTLNDKPIDLAPHIKVEVARLTLPRP